MWKSGITLADYERAEAQLRETDGRTGFYIHAVLYTLVNIFLLVVNLVAMPGFLWFFFPLVGWGIGLALQYFFAVRFLGRQTGLWQARVERRARGLRAPIVSAD